MTGWQWCVLSHWRDADRPRRAVDGLAVCAGCHAKTLRALLQLPPLHRLLGELVAVTTAAPRNGGRSAADPIPLHDAAAEHRRHIRQHLAGWVADTCETQHLIAPAIDAAGGSQRAADTLVGWLLPWHDWLLAQEWADDYADDLTALHSTAWALAYPSGRTRQTFGPCPAGCAGTLVAWLAPGDLLPEALTCDVCDHAVAPSRWLVGRGVRWLTALELSTLFAVPLRTIQRWSAGWPCDGGNPPRYNTEAAQLTRDTRAALTQVGDVAQATP